jgi:hypothetical protein
LLGTKRRFPTLRSLNLKYWEEVKDHHLIKIIEESYSYFNGNPYDTWFRKLDYIISGTGYSYYFPFNNACHLDLIPYATYKKWSEIESSTKKLLLLSTKETLGRLINCSKIEVLVLNGQTVVETIEKCCDIRFRKIKKEDWTLPRREGGGISGYAYNANVESIGGVILNKPLRILGYNHNIQSSFGVTSEVHCSIRKWLKNSFNPQARLSH